MGFTRYTSQISDSQALFSEIVANFRGGAAAYGGAQPEWFVSVGLQINTATRRAVLLESTPALDSVITAVPSPSQKYRILLDGVVQSINNTDQIVSLRIYWGTASQLPDVNTIDPLTPYMQVWTSAEYPRKFTHVYAYRHTIVQDKGFALMIYRQRHINTLNPGNTMLCIQRPVDPSTGTVKQSGKLPIFALWVEANRPIGQEMSMSTVREVDVNSASQPYLIGVQSYHNLYGFSMMWNHPNILSDLTHVIKVPFGLATDRHIYMQEMDLVALTQASAFITNQEADIDMYGSTRTYTGVFGPINYNYQGSVTNPERKILAGARLCILTSGGGIEPEAP